MTASQPALASCQEFRLCPYRPCLDNGAELQEFREYTVFNSARTGRQARAYLLFVVISHHCSGLIDYRVFIEAAVRAGKLPLGVVCGLLRCSNSRAIHPRVSFVLRQTQAEAVVWSGRYFLPTRLLENTLFFFVVPFASLVQTSVHCAERAT